MSNFLNSVLAGLKQAQSFKQNQFASTAVAGLLLAATSGIASSAHGQGGYFAPGGGAPRDVTYDRQENEVAVNAAEPVDQNVLRKTPPRTSGECAGAQASCPDNFKDIECVVEMGKSGKAADYWFSSDPGKTSSAAFIKYLFKDQTILVFNQQVAFPGDSDKPGFSATAKIIFVIPTTKAGEKPQLVVHINPQPKPEMSWYSYFSPSDSEGMGGATASFGQSGTGIRAACYQGSFKGTKKPIVLPDVEELDKQLRQIPAPTIAVQ